MTALKEMLGGLPPPSNTTIWLQPGSVPPFGPEKVVAKLPEKVDEMTEVPGDSAAGESRLIPRPTLLLNEHPVKSVLMTPVPAVGLFHDKKAPWLPFEYT